MFNDAINAKVKESTWRVVKRLADNWWINVFALASLKAGWPRAGTGEGVGVLRLVPLPETNSQLKHLKMDGFQ